MNKSELYYSPFLLQQSTLQVAVLIDPEKANVSYLQQLLTLASSLGVDWIFVGGSTVTEIQMKATVDYLKQNTTIPIILFPGSEKQLDAKADALLYLSLISGRNPDYLIGKQVQVASYVLANSIPVIPTGYILVNGGNISSTSKVSGTDSLSIMEDVFATAAAGALLGMKAIYLEAGSGAKDPVDVALIRKVKDQLPVKLIVGGGIRDARTARAFRDAGADVIVIGNALEKDPSILTNIMFELKRK